MTTDRRGFLTGAVAGALLPPLLRPQHTAAAIDAQPRIVRRGRAIAVSGRGRVAIAHDQRRTIAIGRRLVDVGGQPVELAISPNSRLCAVTTGFWDEPGLTIVDMHRAVVLKRLEVGPAPFGVAFSADGSRLLVSGGEQEGGIWIVDAHDLEVATHRPLGICPRTVAAVPRSDSAWVTLSGADQVLRVSARSGRVTRTFPTPALPDRVAVSPDGSRLLISHDGRDAAHVSEIVIRTKRLERHRAGRLPSGVAWTHDGRPLVALGGEGSVLRIGGTRRHVGGAPRGLAVAGRFAWTVDALTGNVVRARA